MGGLPYSYNLLIDHLSIQEIMTHGITYSGCLFSSSLFFFMALWSIIWGFYC